MNSEPTFYDFWLEIKKNKKFFLYVSLPIIIVLSIYSFLNSIKYEASYVVNLKDGATNYAQMAEIQNIAKFLGVSLEELVVDRYASLVTSSYQDKDRDKALSISRKWLHKYLLILDINGKKDAEIITKPYVKKIDKRWNNIKTRTLLVLFFSVIFVFMKEYWTRRKNERNN